MPGDGPGCKKQSQAGTTVPPTDSPRPSAPASGTHPRPYGAPVTDPRIWRFADAATLRVAKGTVGEAARPIRATDLVAEHLGLLETIEALQEEPQLFVLCGTGVAGVVTRADVQRQAVSMAALALVLAAKQGLVELTRRRLDGR